MRRRRLAVLAATAAALAGVPAVSAHLPAGAPVTEEFTVATPHGDVHVEVTRPGDDARHPVVFSTSLSGARSDDALARDLVPLGAARAVAHSLGTGRSRGCWDWGGPGEQEAMAAVVSAVAAKSWSDGRVGVHGTGVAAGTTNGLLARRHPAVVTGVSVGGLTSWYEHSFAQGARRTGSGEDRTATAEALVLSTAACDRAAYLQRARDTTPDADDFWRARDHVRAVAGDPPVTAPVLLAHGYDDVAVRTSQSIELFRALPLDDPGTGTVEGAAYKRLVLGQWGAGAPAFENWAELQRRWFEEFLLGRATGLRSQPMVQSQGEQGGHHEHGTPVPSLTDHHEPLPWVYGSSWPLERTAPVELYLRRRPNQPGQLLPQRPGDEKPATYTSTGRDFDEHARHHPDLHEIEWLWYVSEPLAADTRLAGPVSFDVWFSPDAATDGQVNVTLVDFAGHDLVDASEPVHLHPAISRGHLDIAYADGSGVARPVAAKELYRATVTLDPADYLLPKGARLGLLVLGSNVTWVESEGVGQSISVLHDGVRDRASSLRLRAL